MIIHENQKTELNLLKSKKKQGIFSLKILQLLWTIWICYGLAEGGKKKSAKWPPLAPPGCGGEWKKTDRKWWVGIRAV